MGIHISNLKFVRSSSIVRFSVSACAALSIGGVGYAVSAQAATSTSLRCSAHTTSGSTVVSFNSIGQAQTRVWDNGQAHDMRSLSYMDATPEWSYAVVARVGGVKHRATCDNDVRSSALGGTPSTTAPSTTAPSTTVPSTTAPSTTVPAPAPPTTIVKPVIETTQLLQLIPGMGGVTIHMSDECVSGLDAFLMDPERFMARAAQNPGTCTFTVAPTGSRPGASLTVSTQQPGCDVAISGISDMTSAVVGDNELVRYVVDRQLTAEMLAIFDVTMSDATAGPLPGQVSVDMNTHDADGKAVSYTTCFDAEDWPF